jgi:dolichyl-phosphate-mannose--protein O-mannosyl transferase
MVQKKSSIKPKTLIAEMLRFEKPTLGCNIVFFVYLTLKVHELRYTIVIFFCIHVDLDNSNSSK